MMEYIIRELRMDEVPLLNDFLYEAIYIPFGGALPPRSIILNENLQIYVRDFGTQPDDKCLVVEIGGQVVGAVWSRIMNDYGHVADDVPSLAISLYKEFRNHGIGSELLGQMLQLLRRDGYHKVSLSVQKENYAVGMYLKAGFQVWEETSEEYIMTYNLDLWRLNNLSLEWEEFLTNPRIHSIVKNIFLEQLGQQKVTQVLVTSLTPIWTTDNATSWWDIMRIDSSRFDSQLLNISC